LRLIIAFLALSACTAANPVTLLKASRLSPLTADPEILGVNVELPTGVGVLPDGALISFYSERTDTGEALREAFVLQVIGGTLYQFNPADLERLRTTQTTVRQWEDAAPRANSGGISLFIKPCVVGDGPEDDARASVQLRLDKSGTLNPLFTNQPISEVIGDQDLSEWPQCSGPR